MLLLAIVFEFSKRMTFCFGWPEGMGNQVAVTVNKQLILDEMACIISLTFSMPRIHASSNLLPISLSDEIFGSSYSQGLFFWTAVANKILNIDHLKSLISALPTCFLFWPMMKW